MASEDLGLTKLPLELLRQVCEYLGDDDPDDLVAFARMNKFCHSVAKAVLFRTIVFIVTGPNQLAAAARQCIDLLQRNGANHYVSQLVIHANAATITEDEEVSSDYRWLRPRLCAKSSYSELVLDDSLKGSGDRSSPISPDRMPSPEQLKKAWQPLLLLMESSCNLQDLIYLCPASLSAPLLQILLQHQPLCRLHFKWLRLYSLYKQRTTDHKMKLVTFPSSCRVHYQEATGDEHNYQSLVAHQDCLVSSVVEGSAGGLSMTHVVQLSTSTRHRDITCQSLPEKPSLNELDREQSLPSEKALLQSLRIGGLPSLDDKLLKDWLDTIDFSSLRALKLKAEVTDTAMKQLVDSDTDLSRLNTLLLRLEPTQILLQPKRSEPYYKAISSLLSRQMSTLTCLQLYNWARNVPLRSFSPQLTTLHLLRDKEDTRAGALSAAEVADLIDQCPLLEDLDLTIRRSKGNEDEVSIYQNLGRLSRLRYLNLKLCIAVREIYQFPADGEEWGTWISPNEPWFDEFDQSYSTLDGGGMRRGHVKEAIMNCAMDETLALAIYNTIINSMRLNGNGNISLRRLELCPVGWECLGGSRYGAIQDFFGVMARGRVMRLNRTRGSRVGDTLSITEFKVFGGRRVQTTWRANRDILDELVSISRRIWPSKHGITDPKDPDFLKGCQEDWRSLPLANQN